MAENRQETVGNVLSRAVLAVGCEFVGYEQEGGNGGTLRVYIDSKSGVNVDDCARVSRQISSVLKVEEPLLVNCTIEVSSPGLNRPLFTLDDYRRFIGRQVKVRLFGQIDGQRNFAGIIEDVNEDTISLNTDGKGIAVKIVDIDKARLVAE